MAAEIDAMVLLAVAKAANSSFVEKLDEIRSDFQKFMLIAPENAIAAAWEAVSKAPECPWSLDQICDQAGCNKRELQEWAVRSFGRPPMRQILHLRLVKATHLLLSNLSEANVAKASGYPTLKAFQSAFIRWTGHSPTDYVRKRRLGEETAGHRC